MFPRTLLLLACLCGPGSIEAGASARPQDPEIPEIPEIPKAMAPAPDLHAEMMELIREIERELGRIDLELFEAGSGELPAAPVGDSGIEQLLLSSRMKMQSVLDGIDHLFEIRDHHEAGGT